MIELGAHPRVIQQRMGHSSIRTTFDVYGSVLPSVDEAVTAGLGDLLRPPEDQLRTGAGGGARLVEVPSA
jgi:integrase